MTCGLSFERSLQDGEEPADYDGWGWAVDDPNTIVCSIWANGELQVRMVLNASIVSLMHVQAMILQQCFSMHSGVIMDLQGRDAVNKAGLVWLLAQS